MSPHDNTSASSAASDASHLTSFDDVPLPPPPEEPPMPDQDAYGSGGFSGNAGQGGAGRGNSGGRSTYRSGGQGAWKDRGMQQLKDAGREMPQNPEAEQGVLGGMLLNKDAIADVVEVLSSDDFYRPAHATIFTTILQLFGEGKEVDPVIVAGRLDRDNQLEAVGGATYLHSIISKTPTSANVGYYAELVKEKATLRRLVQAGTRIVQLGYSGIEGAEVANVVDNAQQEMFALTNSQASEDYDVFGNLLETVMEEIDELDEVGGKAMGIETGFADLDDLTNGLHGGQMVIVAARPGVGKSTLALDFMRSASMRQNKASVLFSLEMSKSEVMMRILSAEAEVRLSSMRGGKMDDDDWARLTRQVGPIEHAPLWIDDSPNLTMMEIRSKARRLKQQVDLQLVVVDYLQLMSSGKKVESRQQEVSEFSRQLKLLAKEIDVPVIAISQLNRGVENRGDDALPRVSDLRESGSLEQDADMVMLIHRPDSQNRDHERAGEADIILAKHRGGPIGTVTVAHQLQFSKFSDMARDYTPMA
ncbi:replicative DNA helicase [Corynebacterium sp. zg254]|uniref:Replicative DNA helicase n=1 Tax=Corynebacterium zhongnanshanii TaxID=2768834 RepID=A0ABQ6VHI7_9CORY|nr:MULTISPECIES: replicative DNA helicase [Corynebacterium]KAB3519210.1 replicative DNA helicase [Corynebacterium zhongnanshanii]MCR5915063.1 replicative DNA helicase [Corynebacterium sp. zg254]